MKARIFSLAVAVLLIAFSVNTTLMAQNKETNKTNQKDVKKTEQKIEMKTVQNQNKINQNKPETTEKAKEVEKTLKHDTVNKSEKETKELTHKKVTHNNTKIETKKNTNTTEKK